MIERITYQCEHCKTYKKRPRVFFSKKTAQEHERGCFYNLENKTCFTCNHNTLVNRKSCKNICDLGKNSSNDSLPVSMQIAFKCKFWEG